VRVVKIFVVLTVVMVPACSVRAAEDTPFSSTLTFSEFCGKVIGYYPKLKQQNADIALAVARKLEAISGFLPRVRGEASLTKGDDPVYVFGTLLRQNSFHGDDLELSRLNTPRPRSNYGFSVTGEMPIFDALQAISRTRSASLKVEAAKYGDEFVKTEAILVAIEAYLKAVALEKVLRSAEEVASDSETDIKQAEELKEKGMILGADYYSARVMFGGVVQTRNRLAREKQAMHAVMNILMGRDPLDVFEITGDLESPSADERPIGEWFDEALRSRRDLLAAAKAVEAQDAEVRREKYTVLPRINAFGSLEEDTHSLDSNGGQNYMMGLKAQMDLYDPSYPSRVKAAEETLRKLKYDKTMLEDAIKKDLSEEFSRYNAAQDNASVLRGMYEDGAEAVKLMMPLYREGRKSIADLIEMRQAYLGAAKGYYGLLSEAEASRSRMLFLSGQLGEESAWDIAERIGE